MGGESVNRRKALTRRTGPPSELPKTGESEPNGLPGIDATVLWISDRGNCATVRNPETYTKPDSSQELSTVHSQVIKIVSGKSREVRFAAA
jgi:hypothetical protein